MNTISVTDLRQDATNVLNQVTGTLEPTYVLQNSQLKAVILDADYYKSLQEALEDFIDGADSYKSLKETGGILAKDYAVKRWGKVYEGNSQTTSRKTAK